MCINYTTTTRAVFYADFVWDNFPKHQNKTAISPTLKADSSSKKRSQFLRVRFPQQLLFLWR